MRVKTFSPFHSLSRYSFAMAYFTQVDTRLKKPFDQYACVMSHFFFKEEKKTRFFRENK